MGFCEKCGSQLNDNKKVCEVCGHDNGQEKVVYVMKEKPKIGLNKIRIAAIIIDFIFAFGFFFLFIDSLDITSFAVCFLNISFAVSLIRSKFRFLKLSEKICTLIFANIISGILLFFDNE